mmetsp:Transcript_26725/g.57466  ORF Transcript_26725/g.57466 Transcript_26725/m.57466 type:complete len:282 (+) Transcript_26725:95-940(+)
MSGNNTKNKTHYDVLGIDDPKNSNQAVIRKAYLRTSLRCHPDKNPGREEEAKAEFVEVGQAYSILKDDAKRAAYDRELAAGKGRPWPRPQRPNSDNQADKDEDFDNFMDMFDATVSGLSEDELNMAMGAAAVVGSIIGSIVGARAGKGNSLLSSAVSMMGSAMASQAASKMVKTVHEDSRQRVLDKEERGAALARGETVPEPSRKESRERVFQDAGRAFQKVAGAAVGGSSSTGRTGVKSCSGNNAADNNSGFSWKEAAKLATMAASACAEMKCASNSKRT